MATNVDFILKNGLQVGANVKVGSGYVGNLALFAPENGLIVEGKVGVGTMLSASAQMTVSGNVSITNNGATLGGIIFPDGTWQDTAASASAAGVLGSVQFNNGSGYFDYDQYFIWDTTNNRLGIGTESPASTLHVWGTSTPALFDTSVSSNPTIVVGNAATTGAILSWSHSGQFASLKTTDSGNPMIAVTATGVGINNVTAPANAMDIGGGLVVGGGIAYAGNATAPTNGMLIQGSVGIGTFGTPAGKLDIRPSAGQAGLLIKNPESTPTDFLRFVDASNAAMFTISETGNVTVGTWNGTTVKANYGGTGLSSYTTGDMLYATSNVEALSKLAIGASGNVLLTTGTAPSWGKVGLTTHVDGVLGLANGGTNNGSLLATNGAIIYGDGTKLAESAVGLSGNILISGGAGAPTWGLSYSSSNVANTVVVRDAGGNIAVQAGTFADSIVVTGSGSFTGGMTVGGTATVNALVSNGAVSGTTGSFTGAFDIGGAARVNSLESNGAVTGTTGSYTGAMVIGGAATVNSLSSNGAISGTTGTFSSKLTADSATVTNGLQVGGTATVNSLTSNTAVTVNAGGINVTGYSQLNGNVNISGNLFVSGNITSVDSNVLVVSDPIIYIGEDNPANLWDLGIVASYTTDIYRHTGFVWNHTTDTWTLFDNLITEPGETINWSQPGLLFGDFKAGDVIVAGTTPSTTYTNGALTVAGGAGITGDLNVHGNITVDGAITLSNPNVAIAAASIKTGNLQVTDSAIVQGITSNTFVNGQTGSFSGAVDIGGTATVNALVSNGAVSGTTGSFTGAMVIGGTATVNALASNGAITGTTIGGTIGTFSTSLTAQEITSNTSVSGQTGSFTGAMVIGGTTTVNALVSNGAVSGSTGSFSGAFVIGGTTTVNSLVSNGAISGTTVDGTIGTFSTSLTAQTITSNTSVSGQTGSFTGAMVIGGATTVNSLTSNGAVTGTTGSFTGAMVIGGTATVNSLESNGAISGTTITGTTGQFSSTLTGQSIVSNSSVSGQTGSFTGAIVIGGTATVNALASNGAITGTTIGGTDGTFSGTVTANALVSNSSITGATGSFSGAMVIGGATTVNSLASNGAITGTTIGGTEGTFSTSLTSQAITSNTSVSGQTGSFTGAMVIGGATTVNSLTSNGAVSGTSATFSSVQTSGTTTADAIVSNTTVSGNSFVIGGSVASTGGTSPVTLDQWETTKFRTVHYIAQVTDNTNAGDFQAAQFMILHDDTTPFKSEYNMMWTNAPLGTFDASISGGNVVVTFTATASTNKTIKVTRTGVTV